MQSAANPNRPKTRGFLRLMFGMLGVLYFALVTLAVAYVWLIAQDRFLSIATFKISRDAATSGDISIGGLGLPGLSDGSSSDSEVSIGFVRSTDLLLELEDHFKLREHYESPKSDFVFRLRKNATLEERLDYYRKRIYATYDKETGLTNLTIDTFDPKLSKALADNILGRTEEFINRLNQTIANQQLKFLTTEVDRAEKQVSDVSLAILKLQNSHNLINPDEAISSNLKILQDLKMERLRTETTLASIERDSPGSPRIETLRSQLRSLDEQIAVETAKLSGPEQERLNQILYKFKELQIKLDFFTHLRTGAETMLEKHRMDAAARSRFLSTIQRPYLPEDVGYPQRGYATCTIAVVGILLFLLLRVLLHSVYERAV